MFDSFDPKRFSFDTGSLVEFQRVGERHNLVHCPMDAQDRHVNFFNPVQVVELITRQVISEIESYSIDTSECTDQYNPSYNILLSKITTRSTTYTLAKQYNTLRIETVTRYQMTISSLNISIQQHFSRLHLDFIPLIQQVFLFIILQHLLL